MTTASDPLALLRTRSYVGLLVLAGIIGVPISAAAWGFLDLVNVLQSLIFTDLPHALGFKAEPIWWPLPLLALSGVLVAATIRYLPGTAGHLPAKGFQAGGAPAPIELPGVFFAALTSALYVREGAATDWHHIVLPPILWFNTLALIASSIALELARHRR